MRKPVNISTFAAVKTFCLTLKTLKGMKKLMYLALAFIAIATGFTACQQKSTSISGIDNEFKLEEVAPFFYKVVYDKDYDFNAGRAMVNDLHMGKKSTFFSGGCTEVRHGNQVGRNLDWNVNYEAAAVQWMPGTDSVENDIAADILGRKQRFSSVGMVGANPHFKYPCIVSQEVGDTLSKTLALSMTDGINEKGVYIGVNVAPAGETSKNPGNWKPGIWGTGASFTNPKHYSDSTNNAMCVTYLTRIILNYAESVDDAIRIIDSLNWFEPYKWEYNEDKTDSVKVCQAFHWLICDSNKSAVVEFIDNTPRFITSGINISMNLGSAITNFSNCIYNPEHRTNIQHGGTGYERFHCIKDYFITHSKDFDMEQLMEEFHYSKFYHEYYNEVKSKDKKNYRFRSEFAFPNRGLPADKLYPKLNTTVATAFVDSLDSICQGWPQGSSPDSIRKSGNDSTYWYTTHTSIYDLTRKNNGDDYSFKVLIHEGYDEKEKNPDGSKKMVYREFALGKPGIVDPYKVKTNDK